MKESHLGPITLVLILIVMATRAVFAQNYAIEFDAGLQVPANEPTEGSTGRVKHSKSLNLTEQLTMEAWIYPTALDAAGGRRFIVGKAESWFNAIGVENSSYQAAVNAAQWSWEGTGEVNLNEWSHAATSFDRTGYELHVNGVHQDTIEDPGAINTYLADVTIGCLPQWGEAFTGYIDEVRISDVAKYPAGNFVRPDPEFEPDENTVLLSHFDEGSGDTTNDDSGNGNHGTLEGGATWKKVHEQCMKLKHGAETLQETGDGVEGLAELEQQISKKEQERKKLAAHLKHQGKKEHFGNREAQIHKLQGAIKELQYALEHHPDSPKAEEWKKSLHEHEEKMEWLMAELHEKHEHRRHERRRTFPEIEGEIERTKMELMELRHMAEDLREGGHLDRLEEVEHEISEREEQLEELTDHLEERRHGGRKKRGEIEGKLAIFRLKHAHALELGEVIEPFLTHSGVITVYPPGNVLIIRDTPPGLEAAHMIIEALDIPHEADIHRELKIDR